MVQFQSKAIKKSLKINYSWTESYYFQHSFNCHSLELLRTAPLPIHKGNKKLTSTTVVSFFPAEMSSPAYANNGKLRDFLLLLNMDKPGMGVLPQVGVVPHVTLFLLHQGAPVLQEKSLKGEEGQH